MTPPLRVGIHYGGTEDSVPPVDLARAAEERGLDSIFVPEHSHIPSVRRTPFPGSGEVPERYFGLWDPLVSLSFVAASTGLTVGTCTALPGGHDPISYAKAVATLDVLSGGRLVLGVGFGWNDDEFEDHGFDPHDKYAVVEEKIALMKALWTEDEAAYEGNHVRLSPSRVHPKPVQHPHPPVLLGCRAGRIGFRRIARWADGWIPMGHNVVDRIEDDLELLAEEWERVGRDPADIRVTVLQAPRPDLADVLDRFRGMPVERVVVDVPTAGEDVVLPALEEIARAAQ
ncbi:putative F420-dependent oxidoreductase [Rhodococcus rhodochrous J45]|uniref:Putative F420-dependent oxidoreductase n=1 Tax=Rhodococcus rhodochrous J45 TaxID=935266 RepID=A0A562EQR6_RHORH|nr:TIGR03619 family F420-dependent LLM class oxidoreductase [Rhodococcus rhodochrous]TWH24078.1 putative F420-dependent oxidoreductase [Rhodococcus rhodochrous J45]